MRERELQTDKSTKTNQSCKVFFFFRSHALAVVPERKRFPSSEPESRRR
jgi:hypothetical protein